MGLEGVLSPIVLSMRNSRDYGDREQFVANVLSEREAAHYSNPDSRLCFAIVKYMLAREPHKLPELDKYGPKKEFFNHYNAVSSDWVEMCKSTLAERLGRKPESSEVVEEFIKGKIGYLTRGFFVIRFPEEVELIGNMLSVREVDFGQKPAEAAEKLEKFLVA